MYEQSSRPSNFDNSNIPHWADKAALVIALIPLLSNNDFQRVMAGAFRVAHTNWCKMHYGHPCDQSAPTPPLIIQKGKRTKRQHSKLTSTSINIDQAAPPVELNEPKDELKAPDHTRQPQNSSKSVNDDSGHVDHDRISQVLKESAYITDKDHLENAQKATQHDLSNSQNVKVSIVREKTKDVAVEPRIYKSAEAIYRKIPEYPRLARINRFAGDVVIEVKISEDGKVIATRTLKGNPILVDAALKAAREWRFSPAIIGGILAPSEGRITFKFELYSIR